MYDLIIEDATLLSSRGRQVADIAIQDGRVAYIGSRPGGRAREKLNAIGKFIMPGVIDTHVHFRDPGHPLKESWASGSRAAVSGGVTTVLDMPNTSPPTTDMEALSAKRALAAANARCNYGVWAGAAADNVDDLNRMIDAGAVAIKIFMGSSTGPLLVPPEAMEKIFAETHGLIGVHAEDEATLVENSARFVGVEAPNHNEVRPPDAAAVAVRQLIELVRAHDRAIHICHLSTAQEIHLLDPIGMELPITVEACPHHLFLSQDQHGDLGNWIKCNPPVRAELDRRALWAALKRKRIDTIGSDHAPHTREEKERGYWDAPSGIPGVETTLPLLLSAAYHGKLSLEQLVFLTSENPARIFGLEGKGKIEVGADADLVLFTEGKIQRFTNDDVLSRCGWSPFHGRECAPKPDHVLVGGQRVASAGKIVNDEYRGHDVKARPTPTKKTRRR